MVKKWGINILEEIRNRVVFLSITTKTPLDFFLGRSLKDLDKWIESAIFVRREMKN